MNRARQAATVVTCAASRHVAIMAEALAKGRPYPMLQEEPEHCAGSLAATVGALWRARAERDQRPGQVVVGRFALTQISTPGKVHIRDQATGEGGTFNLHELEQALATFFGANF